jgi:hypothetical protein
LNHRTRIQALNAGAGEVSDRIHSVGAEDGSRIDAGRSPTRHWDSRHR